MKLSQKTKTNLKKMFIKITDILPDELYIKLHYFLKMRRFCNLNNPRTFSEKMNYLKLKQHGQEYLKLTDKVLVREHIKEVLGSEYLSNIICILDKPEDIDFEKLPNKFVIKCNHGSGYNVIVSDKSKLNVQETIQKLKDWQDLDFWKFGRELVYKGMQKKLVIEEYLEDNINDYKFFCFDGKPLLMFVATDRGIDTRFDFFDMNFNHLKFEQGYKNNYFKRPSKPKHFEKMKELAVKLSQGYPHVRIDFYEVNDKIYFGEYTFYHFSGWMPIKPHKYDIELGKLLKINKMAKPYS